MAEKKVYGCQILMRNGKYISWEVSDIKEYKAIKEKISKGKPDDIIDFGPTIALRQGAIDCIEFYEGTENDGQN